MQRLSQASGGGGFGVLWRRFVLAFTLFAFAQAGYVTQTHIHGLAGLPGNSVVAQVGTDKAPSPDDPAHCPFCREYLQAGAYLAPPPVALPLPGAAAFEAYQLLYVLPFVAALSHGWHGRAPPPPLTHS